MVGTDDAGFALARPPADGAGDGAAAVVLGLSPGVTGAGVAGAWLLGLTPADAPAFGKAGLASTGAGVVVATDAGSGGRPGGVGDADGPVPGSKTSEATEGPTAGARTGRLSGALAAPASADGDGAPILDAGGTPGVAAANGVTVSVGA